MPPQLQTPNPLPLLKIAEHLLASCWISPVHRLGFVNGVSVTLPLFWMWVAQARIAGAGLGAAGLQVLEEIILMSPVTGISRVRGLDVRSLLTLRVSRPSGVIAQAQHSDNS